MTLLLALCTRGTVSYYSAASQARNEGRASRAAGRGSNPLWALRLHWNNRKYGASKLKLPRAKEFLRKLTAFSARTLKNFASPVIGRKNLKNVGFKGSQIIGLPGAPTCLGPALPLAGQCVVILSVVSSRQLDSSLLSYSSYHALAQKASQADIFFNHVVRCMKAETCLLRIHIPEGPSVEQKQQLLQVYSCTAAVCMTLLVRLDFTALECFNTLRTGDADLRFYVTTVQDG